MSQLFQSKRDRLVLPPGGLQNMAAYFNFDCDMYGGLSVKELKEKGPDILLVRESSALRQGGIFDRKKAGYTLQPDLQ